MFGYTKGSPWLPFIQVKESLSRDTKEIAKRLLLQVFGRNFVLLALLDSDERMQEKPFVFYLFAAYTTIEIVRYPYYMLRVYDIDVSLTFT